jgi:hypothetical protein
MTISGTAAAFSLATRLMPGLIAWCVGRLGMERQMTRDPDACHLQEPTLFVPSQRASGVHGPFGRHARGRSMHLWLVRRGTMAVELLTSVWRDRAARPDVPSLPTHPPPSRDRELDGLDARPGAS